MKIILLLTLILFSIQEKRVGIVTTTICYSHYDSCRVTIKLLDNNKDTILYYKKTECPKLLTKIYFN